MQAMLNESVAVGEARRCRFIEANLREVVPFRRVPRRALNALGKEATISCFPARSTILSDGELGDALYLLIRGEARAFRVIDGEEVEISILKPGDFFGEWSMLTGAPLSASIQACTDVEVIRVECLAFLNFIQQHPRVRDTIDLIAHNRQQANLHAN